MNLFCILFAPLIFFCLTVASFSQESIGEEPEDEAPAAEAPSGKENEDRFQLDPSVVLEAFRARNFERSFDLAITFAARGDVPSMRLLGQMYANGFGVAEDQTEAAEWFGVAAEQGDTEAQVLLATMLLDGVHVESDPERAARLLVSASEAQDPTAMQMLGALTLEGKGVERDIGRAAELIRASAELGNSEAQYTLGILYQEGAGVRQDNRQAYRWFETAARKGNSEAQVEFALGLLNGLAGDDRMAETDRVEDAVFWFKRAAEAGNPIAENRLAHAYAQGIVVRLDPVQAAYLHFRAVAGGLGDPSLDSFVAGLTDDQRAQARAQIERDRAPANPFD
ncbi:MAG: tetratricopeptide repeat protein [Pseudomonadota bacterium]